MIKKTLILVTLLTAFISCQKKQSDFPTMDFTVDNYDFGTINEGQVVENNFVFKNTGSSDLIITDVQASCGCTVAEYPKLPVKSMQEGVIKVKFNSRGKHGKQEKTIAITANTKNKKEILKIVADIKPTSGISGY